MTIARARGRFPGGLVMPHRKRLSAHGKIVPLPTPSRLVLPLQQHLGAPACAIVAVDQQVLKGECIAEAEGAISANLHAPTSGRIRAIEARPVPHPSGRSAACIVLEPDGEERWRERRPLQDALEQPPEVVRRRLFQAGVVGLGGACFPTHAKLVGAVETLIINGAECEPYIACDEVLILQQAEEILLGSALLSQALAAQQCILAVEDHRAEIRKALRQALASTGLQSRIELRLVPSRYPEGGERQLIQVLTGREVPSGGLPGDIGLRCLNVATAQAAWRAVRHDEPLLDRVVTVTGRGVKQPGNFRVPLGTAVKTLVAAAGGYSEDAARLVMGGPMMGLSLPHDDHPVIKGCNCILALSQADVAREFPSMPCIRCGACVDCCPAGLLPQQLFWHIRAGNHERARDLHLADCIECGCCAQVCPSQLPLVAYYRHGKSALVKADHAREAALAARQRHEQRSARLQRAERDRQARLAQHQRALEGAAEPGKAEIAAAVARAQRKHRPRP